MSIITSTSSFSSEKSKVPSNAERKYIQLTEEEKLAHVKSYVKSNLSRQDYCKVHGLKLSSFKSWTSRYRDKCSHHFVPAVMATPELKIETPLAHIEIHKKDSKVILQDINNVNTVIEIIRGVLSCN